MMVKKRLVVTQTNRPPHTAGTTASALDVVISG